VSASLPDPDSENPYTTEEFDVLQRAIYGETTKHELRELLSGAITTLMVATGAADNHTVHMEHSDAGICRRRLRVMARELEPRKRAKR
jgi:hypothetical protein